MKATHGVLALLVLIGCGKETVETVETFEGTATLAGKPAKITSCKAVGAQHEQVQYVVVEFGLDTGHTVRIDTYLGSQIRKGGDTTELSGCGRMSSSGSHGRAGSSAWATGKAGLTCATPDGELVLDVTYDCGAKERPSNRVPDRK